MQFWTKRLQLLIAAALYMCCVPTATDGARVLVFLPMASKSHTHTFLPIMEALSTRGHDITYVTIHQPPSSLEKLANFNTIMLHEAKAESEKMMKFGSNITTFNLDTILKMGPMMKNNCLHTLNDTNLQKFIKNPGQHDVVLVSSLMNHCYLPIAWLFKIPIIYVSPSTLLNNVAWDLDVPYPMSYVPMVITPFHSPMNFVQRCMNVLIGHGWQLFDRYFFDWIIHDVVVQFVPDALYSNEIVHHVSLVLVNSHVSLQEPRPTMPYIIDVGGMQCRPGQKLPKEFKDFIEGSGEHGFIVFSMGSVMQGQFMPEETIEKLKTVFSKVKLRVIWKFEKKLDGVSNNTMINEWIPQQDLIAHPKCRLAITHGGLLSLQEVIYHGVPLLGFPQGADRDSNLNTAVSKGFAEILDLKTVTEDELLITINRMLGEKSYRERAQEVSAIMKDRPNPPAETAAYWVEYVIRHKGAPHLKSGASQLNLIQYLLLDVWATFAAILGIIILVTFWIIRFLWRRCCHPRNKPNQKKRKTN